MFGICVLLARASILVLRQEFTCGNWVCYRSREGGKTARGVKRGILSIISGQVGRAATYDEKQSLESGSYPTGDG